MIDHVIVRPCRIVHWASPPNRSHVECVDNTPSLAEFWGAYWECPEGFQSWLKDFADREEAEAFAALLNT